MDCAENKHRCQFDKPIPKRSKFRINIFVWTCWHWHKQMREEKRIIKNKLIFASWNESHSLSRRLAIALRDKEANPNDTCNYKDPYGRIGDRYRTYWLDHREYHDHVFRYEEPSLEFPEDYEKPIFLIKNAFPTHMNTSNNIQEIPVHPIEIRSGSGENGTVEACVSPKYVEVIRNSITSQEQRPKLPSSYTESPELIVLIKYINSRDHEICLSMIIDFLKNGELLQMQENRIRIYELLINAGFSSDFISKYNDYMEYYICNNLKFMHKDLWKMAFHSIEERNSVDDLISTSETIDSQLGNVMTSSNSSFLDFSKFELKCL